MERNLRETSRRRVSTWLPLLLFVTGMAPVVLATQPSPEQLFRNLKYQNLLKNSENLNEDLFQTIHEIKSKNLQGYNDQDNKRIFYKPAYKLNMTEEERLIDQIETLRVFLIPLGKAWKELQTTSTRHTYGDVRKLRSKVVDILFTITYVAKHLGYSIPNYDRVKAKQTSSTLLFPKTTRPLGNRVVSLLRCLQDQVVFIQFYYRNNYQQQRTMVRK